ncbi:MAG: GMC family oxidoreductase N-terminal domain-containing protein [Streptosporangiaceae bacterium]|jgi:choline dehydrogenase
MEEFDYVVVGGGTAGCVIAARLTQDRDARVLLLEAGDAARNRALTVPDAWPGLLGSPADWRESTTPQADAGRLPYPRGRTLGGSGAINAMAHIRGHRSVYDSWPAGWRYDDLLPYFRRSENASGRGPAVRGMSGPVRVGPVPASERNPVARAFADGLASVGCPVTDDLSGRRQEGICWPDLAITRGHRVSPADAYLGPALGRPNLSIRTGCLITRLLISHGRCTGVSYRRDGLACDVAASGEVIVCAGAIGSPKLLMLSGVGPARQLRAHGISLVADVLAVGQNLRDHPAVMVCYETGSPTPRSRYNHGEVYAAVRSHAAGRWPDLHLFPILLPIAPVRHRAPDAGYAITASVVAPDSRGTVRLASADPLAAPLIDPGFLREGRDLERLVAGVGLIRRAAAGGSLSGTEMHPGVAIGSDGASLRGYIRRAVGSYFHPAGTCRIGDGENAVVDGQLRVRGVDSLRIADASVMPLIPNAPLNATVLAIAEKAASLIGETR